MKPSAIERACEFVGGQSRLADKLVVSSPTVNEWVAGSRDVPEEQCPLIERLCEGAVTCEQLREDIAWLRTADGKWPWHPRGRPLKDVSVASKRLLDERVARKAAREAAPKTKKAA